MSTIKHIEYNNEYITLETENNIYKIPNNNTYIRNLLYRGIDSNTSLDKDIKFYDKCATVSVYPIWIALAFVIYGIATKFVLLDLIMIGSGGMVGLSLLGTTVFKFVEKKLKKQANNNEYFTEIYEYAKNGGKIEKNLSSTVNKNSKTNDYSKNSNQKPQINNNVINNNTYHLTSNQIIQDEEIHQRKR